MMAGLWRSASRENHHRRPQQCDQNANGDVVGNGHGPTPTMTYDNPMSPL
jgi:hypothetical protein